MHSWGRTFIAWALFLPCEGLSAVSDLAASHTLGPEASSGNTLLSSKLQINE